MAEMNEANLNEVERRLEEALRNFAGNGSSVEGTVADITAGERIDKIGNLTALAIVETSDRTAKDIEEAAQAAVGIANDIMAEAQQLAIELRANGKRISEHLKDFALLANKVSTAMRNTRAKVLNDEDPLPRATVLAPVSDNETIQ
jgi:ABC-type transporter Mla subunit MlaD